MLEVTALLVMATWVVRCEPCMWLGVQMEVLKREAESARREVATRLAFTLMDTDRDGHVSSEQVGGGGMCCCAWLSFKAVEREVGYGAHD